MKYHRWCGLFFSACAALAAAQGFAAEADAGDVDGADRYLRDSAGRIDYMVDLRPEVALGYPRTLLKRSHFPSYHRSNGVNAVQSFEAAYGFRAHSMTSWIGLSFTAYLDPSQVQRLKKDPAVESIVPNEPLEFSAFNRLSDDGAVWNDQYDINNDRVTPWGTVAVNASHDQSSGSVLVYVVDAGVGQHQDLNVVERVLPSQGIDCGTRSGLSPCTSMQLQATVSCYTHSTAVAGVIGAKGLKSWGVNPNVNIVSVSTYYGTEIIYPNCQPANLFNPGSIRAALDWVKSDISLRNPSGLTSVVNLSFNWVSPSLPGASKIMEAIADLSHPTSGPGALVVQSAGNQHEDACLHSYSSTAVNDGVLVVGALNTHGQPVVPLTDNKGFWRDSAPFPNHEAGSNYGSCVELWAPGDGLYMPMANPDNGNIQDGNTLYTTYGFGSGTSFSAPHVAGLAAKLIETQGIQSPSAAEAAVRQVSYALGSQDQAGSVIKFATNNGTLPSPSQTPYGELSLYSYDATGTLIGWQVNGFTWGSNYGQLPTWLTAHHRIKAEFNSYGLAPYGCSVLRQYALPGGGGDTYIVNNATSLPLTGMQDWDPGNTSTLWAVSSPCYAYGTRVNDVP